MTDSEEIKTKCRFCSERGELGTCGTCQLDDVCPDCFAIGKCCARRSRWVDLGDDY